MTLLPLYLEVAKERCKWPYGCNPDVTIVIASSKFNAKGSDDPADEYVCLLNEESDAVRLTNWEIRDSERTVNALPAFTLEGGASVRVHPGRGSNTEKDLYGEEGRPVWNNGTDEVTLLDADDELIDTRSYGAKSERDGGGCVESPGGG